MRATRAAGLVVASLACLAMSPWPGRPGHHLNGNELADLVLTDDHPDRLIRLDVDPFPNPHWHPQNRIGTGNGAFTLVGVADPNGDGDEDLILQGDSTYRINLLHRVNSMQGATSVAVGFLPRGDTRFGAVGDVDCDGKADLVLNGPSLSRVLLMDGTEPHDTRYVGNGGGEYPITLLADVDGDGCDEAVAEGASSPFVRILDLSPSNGGPTSLFLGRGASYALVGAGDANGDGKQDLFFDGPTQTRIDLLDGLAGRLGSGWIGNGGGAHPVAVLGDFDGDGRDDLVFRYDQTIRIDAMNGTDVIARRGVFLIQATPDTRVFP